MTAGNARDPPPPPHGSTGATTPFALNCSCALHWPQWSLVNGVVAWTVLTIVVPPRIPWTVNASVCRSFNGVRKLGSVTTTWLSPVEQTPSRQTRTWVSG